MRSRSPGAGIALLAVLALAACGGGSPDTAPLDTPATTAGTTTSPAAPATTTAAPGTAPAAPGTAPAGDTTPAPAPEVPPILQLSAPLVGGGELDVGATFGGRPVAFWFWAPG